MPASRLATWSTPRPVGSATTSCRGASSASTVPPVSSARSVTIRLGTLERPPAPGVPLPASVVTTAAPASTVGSAFSSTQPIRASAALTPAKAAILQGAYPALRGITSVGAAALTALRSATVSPASTRPTAPRA